VNIWIQSDSINPLVFGNLMMPLLRCLLSSNSVPYGFGFYKLLWKQQKT